MSEWQPIETAPEKTLILVWMGDGWATKFGQFRLTDGIG